MQLIPLEEAEKIINSYNRYQELTDILIWEIKKIKTIDPLSEIDKMIEEQKNARIFETPEKVLEELKARLTSK